LAFCVEPTMLSLTTICYRLLWAALLGAVIGIERSVRRRPAGMRTSVCVTMGSALFTIMSVEIARKTGDTSTTRIASNIVQGIGFLGAGVILRDRGSVVGLTTASAIFGEAAIGMAAGAGFYAVSGVAFLIILFVLVVLIYAEDFLNLKPRYMLFRISTSSAQDLVPFVHDLFSKLGIALDNFQVSMTGEKNLIQFDADVSHRQQEKILAAMTKPGVTFEMLPVERQGA
jgi:putative Mg2+ transporter-C (MgtC) family protein